MLLRATQYMNFKNTKPAKDTDKTNLSFLNLKIYLNHLIHYCASNICIHSQQSFVHDFQCFSIVNH